MGLNQNQAEFNDNPDVLETPQAGQVNLIVKSDKTLWGKFPDGTIVQFGGGALQIVGNLDPMGGNINYPAANAGDIYIFISAGTIGAPPVEVEAGEMLLCVTNTAGGAGAGADFVIYQINIQYATTVVAGIVRLVTQAQIEGGVDAEAAVTTNQLYYLLQTYGLSYIKTDEIRGKVDDGSVPLLISPTQNAVESGNQSAVQIIGKDSVNAAAAAASGDAGGIELTGGKAGNTANGTPGGTGYIALSAGAGGASTGNDGGVGGEIYIASGVGGTGVNGGDGGVIEIYGSQGANAVGADSDGGDSGSITIQSLNAGQGTGTGQGGATGDILIKSSDAGNSLDAGGIGGAGGSINIEAGRTGLGDAGSGAAGNVNIIAGQARDIANGANGSQNPGGSINLQAGEGNTSDSGFPGDGGDITMTAGNGNIQVLDGGAGSKGGDGGTIEIIGGDGAQAFDGDGGQGGNIILTPGALGVGGGATGQDGLIGQVQSNGLFVIASIEDAIVAGAGGGFANATRLTKQVNRVGTVAANNDSVKLPLTQLTPGTMVTVMLDAAVINTLDVYPSDAAHTINGAANVSIAPGGTNLTFIYFGGGAWYTLGHL